MSSALDRLGFAVAGGVLLWAAATPAQERTPTPMVLEARIALGAVSGRIDHLAVDLKRQRLIVAELGNNSIGVVDLASGRVLRTVVGFSEPQGIGHEPSTDTIYIADAGDGSVRLLRGEDYAPVGRIDFGSDADNVRVDTTHRVVLVGHGSGALAIIDPVSRAKVNEIRLPAHPESFQLIREGAQAAVNLPDAHRVAIADLANGSIYDIRTGALAGNFPLAVDAAAGRILVGFRNPPMLAAYSILKGQLAVRLPVCADADDLFVDAMRRRVYVSCGAGVVDVLQAAGDGYVRLAQIPTASGARTSLFVPELDRLYVAASAGWSEPAAILTFHPIP